MFDKNRSRIPSNALMIWPCWWKLDRGPFLIGGDAVETIGTRSLISVRSLTVTYQRRHTSRDLWKLQLRSPETAEACFSVPHKRGDSPCRAELKPKPNRLLQCIQCTCRLSTAQYQAVVNAAVSLLLRVKRPDHISTMIIRWAPVDQNRRANKSQTLHPGA